MHEEKAFHRSILTEPDDHIHRLVYADWLLDADPRREPLVRRQALLGPGVITALDQKLVPVPAGIFRMGSPEEEVDRDLDERPRTVILSRPFYLGAFPVTVGEYRTFVQSMRYRTRAEREHEGVGWNKVTRAWERGPYNWRYPGWEQTDREPVVGLTWEDAQAFCAWLSRVDGRPYTLPTEAQWEYACRATSTTPFAFGAGLSSYQANFDGRFPYDSEPGPWVGQTTPVGSYPPNAWGLYDMHGNVWEWCLDFYSPWYPTEHEITDPLHTEEGYGGHTQRGGSWCSMGKDCRSALRRCGNVPWSRYQDGNNGFRLCLPFPSPDDPDDYLE